MSSVDESGNVSLSGNKTNVDRALKDKRWEEVQIKAFTSWLNSLLSPRGLEVNDLTTDLADGLRLVGLCEVTTNKILRGIDKKPMIPIQKINNINIALNSLRNDLHVRLDMIGAEDVFGGNLKMILGMIFATFRKVVHSKIGMLTGEGENESQEVGLLKWIREQTKGYDGVHITDFKNSFNDGLAFNALVHRFDKNLFDYDSIDKNDKAENLKRAFALAEKHLGVPQLLDVNEILSGDADERSIILYSSLYFHAFVSNEERLKAMGLQETLSTQIEDTKTRLQTAESELLAAREDNSALLARLAKLEEQLQFYARARASDQEAMDLLTTKVNVLGGLLEEEKNVRSAAEEARYRLQQEIEELTGKLQKTEKLSESEIEEYRKRLELLHAQEERERRELEQARQKIAETSADFQRELEQMERRKNELAEQIANLRKSVADEKAVRKQREAEVQQLRSEVSKLRAASIPQAKARNGLALLKRNLEEHLEDMYKWRELHHGQTEENRFDLAAVISQTANKTFDETLVYLDDKLAEENRSLLRIVSLSDNQIQDRIEKEGVLRMKFRKDWSKRYFRVVGNKISWYAEDGQGRREGSVDLSKSCEIVRQKALKSDEAGISKFWPLKLTVVLQVKQVVDGTETLVDQEKKLFIRAASKKERHSWFSLISGKIASLNYRQALEGKANPRPDTRILNFLAHSDDAELYLDGRAISDEGILAVTKVIPGHDQLTTISISNAQLSSHAVTTFAEALVKSQAVVSVALSKNNIQSEPGVNLVTRLASLERITDIHLDDNQLGAEVGQALASSLPQLKALKTLNLNGNNLGVAGAGALASSLAQNPIPLTSLQLARNHIQDAAASPIAAYLSHNESVTSVDLSGNELTDAGVAALADGLAHNHSVRILDLSNNKIGAAGAAAIKHLLSSNKLIDEIRLANNNLSASQVEALTFTGFAFKDLTLHRSA